MLKKLFYRLFNTTEYGVPLYKSYYNYGSLLGLGMAYKVGDLARFHHDKKYDYLWKCIMADKTSYCEDWGTAYGNFKFKFKKRVKRNKYKFNHSTKRLIKDKI